MLIHVVILVQPARGYRSLEFSEIIKHVTLLQLCKEIQIFKSNMKVNDKIELPQRKK